MAWARWSWSVSRGSGTWRGPSGRAQLSWSARGWRAIWSCLRAPAQGGTGGTERQRDNWKERAPSGTSQGRKSRSPRRPLPQNPARLRRWGHDKDTAALERPQAPTTPPHQKAAPTAESRARPGLEVGRSRPPGVRSTLRKTLSRRAVSRRRRPKPAQTSRALRRRSAFGQDFSSAAVERRVLARLSNAKG